MKTCFRCGATIESDKDQMCPVCGAPVCVEDIFAEDVPSPKRGAVRVSISMAVFGVVLMVFFSIIASSIKDMTTTTTTKPDGAPGETNKQAADIIKPATDLDSGLVAMAVKEVVDRQPVSSGVLANIMREQIETAGFRVLDAANTIGARDAALDAHAGIYMTCTSRSTSRDETTADGTKQVGVSVTVTVRAYDTSSGDVLAARTKSGRASGPTMSDANSTAIQDVVDKLADNVVSALDRFRTDTEKQSIEPKYQQEKNDKTDINVDNSSPLNRQDVS